MKGWKTWILTVVIKFWPSVGYKKWHKLDLLLKSGEQSCKAKIFRIIIMNGWKHTVVDLLFYFVYWHV